MLDVIDASPAWFEPVLADVGGGGAPTSEVTAHLRGQLAMRDARATQAFQFQSTHRT